MGQTTTCGLSITQWNMPVTSTPGIYSVSATCESHVSFDHLRPELAPNYLIRFIPALL